MRKNRVKGATRDHLATFDRACVELPEAANAASVIVIPMKTVFINISAAPEANVDRLFFDVEDAEAFLGRWGVRFR